MQLLPVPQVIVFDVDGVLVEVTASYRETIRATARHFTGADVPNEVIQRFKNAGGWNNDWDLTHRLIADQGARVEYSTVVDQFNRIFLGDGSTPGLIHEEKWIPKPGFIEELGTRHTLAIFTGRWRYELQPTLDRFAKHVVFSETVTADDVKEQKPSPEGLRIIQRAHPGKTLWYLGDTVDDARAARDAGVPFLGVAARDSQRREELESRLFELGARRVIADVNELMGLLAAAEVGA
jgi:HAD superfamily hydrolase (TIGR01548 family)